MVCDLEICAVSGREVTPFGGAERQISIAPVENRADRGARRR
jgi:hypothetical protein